jgi:fermentation-respiration switch protein FrsA (DUF1100 family)
MPSGWVTLGGVFAYLVFQGYLNWQKFLLGIVFLSLLLVFLLYKYQNNILYQPKIHPQYVAPASNPPGYRNPNEHGLPYANIFITTPDKIRLNAWFIRPTDLAERRQRPTIIWFHANAGNIGFRLDNIRKMYHDIGVNIFILSYRGYGASEGSPSEEGLCVDAETAWNYILSRDDIDRSRVYLFGRSLGGAVALYLGSKHSSAIAGTIIENSFYSIDKMVDQIFPALRPLKRLVLRIKWNSFERAPLITHPLLFITGKLDEVVPHQQMLDLFALAVNSKKKQLISIDEGMHNTTWEKGGEFYVETFKAFLSQNKRCELVEVTSVLVASTEQLFDDLSGSDISSSLQGMNFSSLMGQVPLVAEAKE